MPAGSELITQQPSFTILVNGHFGSGKTHFGMTFPQIYALCFLDKGVDILKRKGNHGLAKNLVWYEYVNPASDNDVRDLFKTKGLLDQYLDQVKAMAEKGEIKTLLVDGFTYFVDTKWRQICADEVIKSSNTGNMDKQAMYMNLGLYLQQFVTRDLLPLSTRYNLNIVVTCHLKRESEQTIDGVTQRAGKVDKSSDIAPLIEGGFRNRVEGLFGASLYLDKTTSGVHIAYCDKINAMRTTINAKNRYGLPAKVENISYDTLMANMDVNNNNNNKGDK